jgi:carbonic anhydrase/acetyltransferase-like protein (isoleucine patch superfamily)
VEIPAGSLVLGVPGRVARRTTEAQRRGLVESAAHYAALVALHRGA